MIEPRLKGIEFSWHLESEPTGEPFVPDANLAREQVRELIAEVRKLRRLLTSYVVHLD